MGPVLYLTCLYCRPQLHFMKSKWRFLECGREDIEFHKTSQEGHRLFRFASNQTILT